jgi:hypothetical protein
VKVTFCPLQIVVPGFAEMLTPAVTTGFTTIVIAFDVAGLPVAQLAVEVITHIIEFPFASEDEE